MQHTEHHRIASLKVVIGTSPPGIYNSISKIMFLMYLYKYPQRNFTISLLAIIVINISISILQACYVDFDNYGAN